MFSVNLVGLYFFQPVEQWTYTNVVEWMTVCNLHKYAETFQSHQVNGIDLVSINENKLKVCVRKFKSSC